TGQISSPSESTAGASCSGGGGGDGDCRNSVSFSTASNGITFTSRYAWNINADTTIFSTHDTSGNAQHNISFSVTAPGAYFLTIDSRRTGDLNRISDASGCDGSADTGATTGSQTGGSITPGTLWLPDPGSIGSCCDANCHLISAGTVCRASGGACDPQEVCTGSSGACPNDVVSTIGTLCRGPAGPCDIAETCDGTNRQCPNDVFLGSQGGSFVCRPAAGPCDHQEICNGASAQCPPDTFLFGNQCRAS